MVEESVLRAGGVTEWPAVVAARTGERPPLQWRGLFREPDWPPPDEDDE
jgi:hypothetical protein